MIQIKNLTIVHKKDTRVILEDFSCVLGDGDKAVIIGEEGNGKNGPCSSRGFFAGPPVRACPIAHFIRRRLRDGPVPVCSPNCAGLRRTGQRLCIKRGTLAFPPRLFYNRENDSQQGQL